LVGTPEKDINIDFEEDTVKGVREKIKKAKERITDCLLGTKILLTNLAALSIIIITLVQIIRLIISNNSNTNEISEKVTKLLETMSKKCKKCPSKKINYNVKNLILQNSDLVLSVEQTLPKDKLQLMQIYNSPEYPDILKKFNF